MTLPDWDERYRERPAMWGRAPNATVAAHTEHLRPGRALDVGCGDGRNALWLAERGWTVVAIDGSAVAIAQLREAAADLPIDAQVVDVTRDPWPVGTFDLVLLSYLHLPPPDQTSVHLRAAEAVAPGGTWLLVGHDRRNLTDGIGGPQDPAVLTDAQSITSELRGTGLTIEVAARIDREVAMDDGPPGIAIDTLVIAHR